MARVILDEAQDVNDLHLRVVRSTLDLGTDPQFAVLGDRAQLLYDYGEFPANVEVIDAPWAHLSSPREWQEIELDLTHRLSPSMAAVVSHLFEKPMTSARPTLSSRAPPVMVHCCSKWDLAPLLYRLVGDDVSDVVIHVSTRRGNAPLMRAVNHMSAIGVPIYFSSSGSDARLQEGKLKISTWHASKGTEVRRNIVLVPRRCEKNPLFVALTRGVRRCTSSRTRKSRIRFLLRGLRDFAESDHVVFADDLALRACQRDDLDEEEEAPAQTPGKQRLVSLEPRGVSQNAFKHGRTRDRLAEHYVRGTPGLCWCEAAVVTRKCRTCTCWPLWSPSNSKPRARASGGAMPSTVAFAVRPPCQSRGNGP